MLRQKRPSRKKAEAVPLEIGAGDNGSRFRNDKRTGDTFGIFRQRLNASLVSHSKITGDIN